MSARNSKNSVCFWWWQWLANSLGSNATKSLHDLHVSRWFWEIPIQCSPLYTLGILNNPKDCSRLRLKTLHLPHFIWHKVKGVACSRQCYLAQGRWPQRPWSQLCSNTDSCVSNKHGCIILWYNISIYWYIYIYIYILIHSDRIVQCSKPINKVNKVSFDIDLPNTRSRLGCRWDVWNWSCRSGRAHEAVHALQVLQCFGLAWLRSSRHAALAIN